MFPHLSTVRMLCPCVTEGNLQVNDNLESVGVGEGRTKPQQNSDGLKIWNVNVTFGIFKQCLKEARPMIVEGCTGKPENQRILSFDVNWITQQEVFLHLITTERLLQISLQHRTIVDAKFDFVA